MDVRTVSFYSEGSKLAADFYLPDGASADARVPAIVLCTGYSGVREVVLPDYAKAFAAAGFAVLNFDFRGFGGSEGQKWRVIASEQVQDIRNAITWVEAQPEVDPARLGIWGTSNGGGHVITVAGLDDRVKCAVGQVGYGEGSRLVLDRYTPEQKEEYLAKVRADRTKRVLTGKGDAVPVEVLLYSPDTVAFHDEIMKTAPEMYAELSWGSAEATIEYRPIDYVDRISPRALMLIGAENDDLCFIDGYREVYDRAKEPKRWISYPVRHHEIYEPKWVDVSAKAAIEWFKDQL
jgi:dipeptidyl aminopeptidase/acylaminoacyl peptidase